jgi:hypothetical protein
MSECLPDLPRYIRQRDNEWQGADHENGPWHPIPAPQSGLPWKTDGPAVPESREPASVAAEARRLSPAAQAIVKAFDDRYEMLGPLEDDWQEQCIAAALLAAADRAEDLIGDTEHPKFTEGVLAAAHFLDLIAAELEGSDA